MILTCAEMKALEERAFADGVSAERLMEEAGAGIAAAVRQFMPEAGSCAVAFGKGHNGGDALVAARHLAAAGWALELMPAFPEDTWADLTRKKFHQLPAPAPQAARGPRVILDGLLGIGAGGALREPIRAATREINRRRLLGHGTVCALDLPTGLDGDRGVADPDTVVADYTFTIGAAKSGLLADAATPFVGRLAVLPLTELTKRFPLVRSDEVATASLLGPLLPRRAFDSHKGDYGRIGIIAGSPGLTGAAVLAAEACVHAGAGLVTLYVSPEAQSLVAARMTPEVMVQAVDTFREVLDRRHDVLALGPGLGETRREEILAILQEASMPVIVDADALNALATRVELLGDGAGPRLLTPHPGEMARLVPGESSRSRREVVERFISRFPVTLLLKGARTIVGERNHPLSYNSTGSPGMATGGMGDVLTGVLAALAGQALSLYDAARLGAWLCGRAAEIALTRGGEAEESLSAGHVIRNLGPAFRDLRAGSF